MEINDTPRNYQSASSSPATSLTLEAYRRRQRIIPSAAGIAPL